MAVFAECGVDQGLRSAQQCLLDQLSSTVRMPSSRWLPSGRDHYLALPDGPVCACHHLAADVAPSRLQSPGRSARYPVHRPLRLLCWPSPASTPLAGSLSSAPPPAAGACFSLLPDPGAHATGRRRRRGGSRGFTAFPPARIDPASDRVAADISLSSVTYSFGLSLLPCGLSAAPATTTSADFSLNMAVALSGTRRDLPGKNAHLHRTTTASRRFALVKGNGRSDGPIAHFGNAGLSVLVHRLAIYAPLPFPRSVTLVQLRFASLVLVNLRRDLHPQVCAHAGHLIKSEPRSRWFSRRGNRLGRHAWRFLRTLRSGQGFRY